MHLDLPNLKGSYLAEYSHVCLCVWSCALRTVYLRSSVLFCANICLDTITTKYSPILVLYKSHKASSYWHVVCGAPKIESNRTLAKLSIKLWQDTPHAKHMPTEDTQVTYQDLWTILVNMHVKLENTIIYFFVGVSNAWHYTVYSVTKIKSTGLADI